MPDRKRACRLPALFKKHIRAFAIVLFALVLLPGTAAAQQDFGDAPDTYSTLGVSGMPKHNITVSMTLGSTFDTMIDGVPYQFAYNFENFPVVQDQNYYISDDVTDPMVLTKEVSRSSATLDEVFHLFSHGRPGELFIEGRWLSGRLLVEFLRPRIRDYSYLNIYGCNFAKGKNGQNTINYLQQSLGIDVAASDNLTGAGGDWVLEVGNSKSVVVASDYLGALQLEYTNAAASGTTITADLVDSTAAKVADFTITSGDIDLFDIVAVRDDYSATATDPGTVLGFRSLHLIGPTQAYTITITPVENPGLLPGCVILTGRSIVHASGFNNYDQFSFTANSFLSGITLLSDTYNGADWFGDASGDASAVEPLDTLTAGTVYSNTGAPDDRIKNVSLPAWEVEICFSAIPIGSSFEFTFNKLDVGVGHDRFRLESHDIRLDIPNPTLATIGGIELRTMLVMHLLELLGVYEMELPELRDFLSSWDLDAAAALSNADRSAILGALRNYLDPDGDGQVALLRWDTLEERGTIGFYAERRTEGQGWHSINKDLLPGMIIAPMGAEYLLADPGAQSDRSYQYRLIELEATGNTRTYGPFTLSPVNTDYDTPESNRIGWGL